MPRVDHVKAPPPTNFLAPSPLTHSVDPKTALIRRVDERLRRQAARVMEAAGDACRLNDDGTPVEGKTEPDGRPKGWSARRYRVAQDARKPLKQAPAYLGIMAKVHDSYRKAEAERTEAPPLAAAVVYLQQNTVINYPVVDVTEREKDK